MFEVTDSYRNKLSLYLNSFDENVERDLLEVDVFDEKYMSKCLDNFIILANGFYETCKLKNDMDVGFRYPSDWSSVRFNTYCSEMIKVYNGLDNCPEEIRDSIYAAMKFIGINGLEADKNITFGKKIGRSVDRYDYFMYLKFGISYKAKYISQEEVIKILKNNKYGYSGHVIF